VLFITVYYFVQLSCSCCLQLWYCDSCYIQVWYLLGLLNYLRGTDFKYNARHYLKKGLQVAFSVRGTHVFDMFIYI